MAACDNEKDGRRKPGMEEKMKIAIGNDHAATELKFVIMDYLKELGHEVINFGTD